MTGDDLDDRMSVGVDVRISFAHALTKHLLNVQDDQAKDIFIGVQPRGAEMGGTWAVKVKYLGFTLVTQALTLGEALDKLVTILTDRVSARLEEGMRLLSKK